MSALHIFLSGLIVYGFSVALSLSSTTVSSQPLIAVKAEEQLLCEMFIKHYNSFVDMVYFILNISFPLKNVFFTGNTEVLFYSAEQNANSPQCIMFDDKGAKLLRVDIMLMIDILNNGTRMRLEQCLLETHLRIETTMDTIVIRPQLVDIHFPGNVYRDGVLVNKTRAEEILRPVLIKGFTSLAEKYLSYSGYRGSALFVNPKLALEILKQLFLSYVAQL